ncbi:MAG: TIGR02710 family CRISPR-associated protein [Methanobacteriaceae archaeon]|jgi:CRISPR-associated protein (TIGR02710 family)|nr:TIGR02710 family CRISPR-associated protein [Candidatus Methanorudis spinitermitis]
MKTLIMTVGGESKPLISAIKHFKPDQIYFIVSELSLFEVPDILKETNFPKHNVKTEKVEDYQKVIKCFESSRKIIKKVKNENSDVIVDFTGGTKPMSSGLLIAALNEGCDFNYTGSLSEGDREKEGLGVVKNTYETMIEQHDPYEFFAISEFNRGLEFFNKYQFESAYKNFKEAYSKTQDSKLKRKFLIYCKLTIIYSYWDKFIEDKGQRLDNRLEKLKNVMVGFKNLTNINFDFLDKVEDNIKFLNHKLEGNVSDNIQYYLIDLINNSHRRIEEGKYDDAVARLYRIFELIAQTKLNQLNLYSKKKLNKEKKFYFLKNNFKNEFNKYTYDKILGKYENYGDIKVSGLYQSYDLLNLIDENIGSKFIKKYSEKDSEIRSYLNSRNTSILAHGLNPISEKVTNELFMQAVKFTKIIISDFDKKKEMATFPKLS